MITEDTSTDWDEDDGRSEVSATKRDSIILNSLDYWDYSIELECLKGREDLELAAELGKTLLERNKELETSLRQCQNKIEDQAQEMEYLRKQSEALRQSNDKRILIYEKLEVSIQELERANQRLALDNATDKKQIRSLCACRDALESKCEELQLALDEARVQQVIQNEKLRRLSIAKEEGGETSEAESSPTSDEAVDSRTTNESATEDLINQLSTQNQELKNQMSKDQRKIADLEEEMCRKVQDIALYEEELCQKEEQVKSLRLKISNLVELRSEHLCAKCEKEIGFKIPQVPQMCFDPEEESLTDGEKYSSIGQLDKEDNPYRTLADMYESIVKEQSENRKLSTELSKSSQCLSLHDELKAYYFNEFKQEPDEDEEIQNKDERKEEQRTMGKNKMSLTTAADFSEAETSSSGFSDETSNKSTQTEKNIVPGSFLCTIGDGDDCKFSIYDDACPIESRFRKTPEYRTLFREIFAVLKRAAEAKDNGEQLPLLDDATPSSEMPKVPPVTPAKEELPIDFEDLQSLPESSNMSEAASETSSTVDCGLDETLKVTSQDESSTHEGPGPSSKPRDARLTNDILEYLSLMVDMEKKSKRKSNNSRKAREMLEKMEGSLPNSPKRPGGRRRKEWKSYDSSRAGSRTQSPAIPPHVLTTLKRKESFPRSENRGSSWVFQPFVSTASQEMAKLKTLEKSYAEVLRHKPSPKTYGRSKNGIVV